VAVCVAVLLAVPVFEPVSEEEPVCELDCVEDAVWLRDSVGDGVPVDVEVAVSVSELDADAPSLREAVGDADAVAVSLPLMEADTPSVWLAVGVKLPVAVTDSEALAELDAVALRGDRVRRGTQAPWIWRAEDRGQGRARFPAVTPNRQLPTTPPIDAVTRAAAATSATPAIGPSHWIPRPGMQPRHQK
jgi:hypothetical protein